MNTKVQNCDLLETDERAMLVSKIMHTYTSTAQRLGLAAGWDVFRCIYDKTKSKREKHVAMRNDILSASLCKKNEDGQNWSVLHHRLSELWMNEKEDTFRIVYKDNGSTVVFGNDKDGKPYIGWTRA